MIDLDFWLTIVGRDYISGLIDSEISETRMRRLLNERSKVWFSADGREIPYNELTDDHLINIIAYIERTGFRRVRLNDLKKEYYTRFPARNTKRTNILRHDRTYYGMARTRCRRKS